MYFFLFFLSGAVLFHFFLLFPFASAAAFVFSAALLIRNKRYLLILPFVIGFTFAFLRYSPPVGPSLLGGREMVLDCVVGNLPQETSSGKYTNRVTVRSAVDTDTGKDIPALHGREVNIISDEGLKQGRRYRLAAESGRAGERLNPGTTEADAPYIYLQEVLGSEATRGNFISAWLRERRERLHYYLKDVFDPDTAALLSSITIGETSGMSGELKSAFSTTGLAHLLSISGTHFGLFSMLVFGIFRLLIRSSPHRFLQWITAYVTPSQAAAVISIPFVLMYLFISGSSIPALRSFIMINIFLVGLLIDRRGFWLNSLLLAAFLICLWDPSSVTNISFQLSFLAVLFIGLFVVDKEAESIKDKVKVKTGWLKNMLYGPLMVSLSASLGTAPLVAYYFHYFSVISPLANLIMTPFIGFVLVSLSLVSAFAFIFTGHYLFHSLIALASGAAIKGINLFASVPYADVRMPGFPPAVIAVFYAGLIIYFLSGKRPYALLIPFAALAVCLLPLVPWKRDAAVTFLDVGQGDSAVIETSHGKTIVVDTGRTGKELDHYLRYLGKRTIDALVVTHADDDHSAGVPYIMKSFPVREIWDSGLLIYPDDLMKNVTHRSLERGDVVTADGLSLYVLHPYRGFYTFSDNEAAVENNDSLVMKVAGPRSSFVFTGDASEEAEEDMLHLGTWLKGDVMKVAHHGSRTSSTEDFVRAVSPSIGIISVGRDNPYGHPHADTLERFRGVKMYRTDRDGAIKITDSPDGGGPEVKTFRECRFERAESISGEWRNMKRLFIGW